MSMIKVIVIVFIVFLILWFNIQYIINVQQWWQMKLQYGDTNKIRKKTAKIREWASISTGSVLAMTKYNYSMVVFEPNTDLISRKIVNKGAWEPSLNAQLDAECPRPSVVVDLGANLGAFTMYALWRGHTVISFEMQIRVFAMLSLSVHLNGWDDRWKGINVVLGSSQRESVVTRMLRNNVGGTYTVLKPSVDDDEAVVTRPLTDFLNFNRVPVIDFLKVDVEGSEMRVLPEFDMWFDAKHIHRVTLECRQNDSALITFMYERDFECNQGLLHDGLDATTDDNVFWSHDEALTFIRNVLSSAQGRQKRYADVFCRLKVLSTTTNYDESM